MDTMKRNPPLDLSRGASVEKKRDSADWLSTQFERLEPRTPSSFAGRRATDETARILSLGVGESLESYLNSSKKAEPLEGPSFSLSEYVEMPAVWQELITAAEMFSEDAIGTFGTGTLVIEVAKVEGTLIARMGYRISAKEDGGPLFVANGSFQELKKNWRDLAASNEEVSEFYPTLKREVVAVDRAVVEACDRIRTEFGVDYDPEVIIEGGLQKPFLILLEAGLTDDEIHAMNGATGCEKSNRVGLFRRAGTIRRLAEILAASGGQGKLSNPMKDQDGTPRDHKVRLRVSKVAVKSLSSGDRDLQRFLSKAAAPWLKTYYPGMA